MLFGPIIHFDIGSYACSLLQVFQMTSPFLYFEDLTNYTLLGLQIIRP